MPLRVLVIQHHPTSPPGLWASGWPPPHRDTTIDAQHGATLPDDAEGHDGLLILGGAMNAYADAACPHFPGLLALARSYAAAGKPVLGICLGAQLLARAWGAKVHVGAAPEFGVVPLHRRCRHAIRCWPSHRPMVPAMQWHDDTFDLPEVPCRC